MHSIQKRLSFIGFELLFILLAGFCQLDGQVKSVRRNNSSFQYSTTQPSTSKAVNAEVGGGTLPQELAAGSEIVSFMKGDSVLGRITFDPNETVNVIVQFKTPPLVLHKHYSKHFAPATYSSTLRQIQTEHQQCMRDVTSIESAPLSPLPKSFKPSATHLKYEYKRSLNGIAISTRRWMVEQIKQLPYVERVDDDVQVQLVDDVSNDVIRADTVWAKTGAEGDSVVIGILDTGIDYLHEALGGAPFPNTKVIGGYDLVNNDADPMDDNGHGTHVAGIAAANGPPPTSLRGVAPHAKLMAFKVLDATGSGSSSSVIAGIEMALDPDGNPATDDAVDIINLSLGGSGDPDDPLCQAVDNAVANGVECVVAAGNSGSSYKTIQSPGVARTALTVGATDNTDHIASFSSRGPSKKLFGIKPDVLAPGVSINSAKAGGGYIQYSGTSMSTPHVAGASALLLQLHRGSSPAVIKGLLMETAKNIGANLWTQGSGRIDVYAAALKPGVVTPASLNLGFYDLNQSTWTEQETLTVRNMSGNSPTYQFSLMAGAPNGVSATFTPSSIALNPGDTAIVVISFSVNGNLVANNNPSGSVSFPYTGTVRAVSQSDTISVPFSFMKTPYLDLTLVGTNPSFLIHNGRDFSVTSLTTSDYPRILLPSGTYDIVALFFSSVQNTYVTRENIAVPATSQITLQQSDAQHVYSIDARDENSQQMNFDRQTTADQFVRRASQFAISSLVLNAPYIPNARYSNVSSAYNYDWQSYSYPNNKPFYTFKGSINDFSADHSFRNYLSDFKHLLLVYTLPPSLTNIMLLEWLNFFRDPQGMGSFWGGSDTYMTAPFIQNAYIMPDPTADFMAGWGLYNLQEVMQTTGPVFNRDASFLYYVLPWLKVKSFTSTQAFLLWDNFSPALNTPGDTLVYGLGPTHWFGRFDNDATNLRIRTNTKYGEYWNSSQGAFYPLFLSQCQDASTKQLTFKLFDASNALIQSGALLDHGTRIITAGNYYDYFADIQVGTGGTYRLEIQDTAYFVQGRQGVALVRATMNTMSGDPNPPSMKTFNILAGNTFTDIITDGQTGTVKFQVNDDHGLQSVVASYRAESDTAWNNLVVTQDSSSYSAIINSNIPHGYVSLRVTATDNSGNTLEYSASPAFKLGSGFPVCVLSCDTMNLGWVLLGAPFIDSMTVTNTGSSVLNVDTVRSDDLWITISPHSASLVPLASQKFYITYTPASVGTHYGHIIFSHNAAGSPDSVVVKGLNVTTMGQGCAIVPTSLNLGTVSIGSSRTDSLMATNTGATRLLLSGHLSSDPGGVSLTPCCRLISALTSQYFYVTLAPPSTGVYNGIIEFSFPGTGSPIFVPVTGTGINSAPSVSPASITFGGVLTTVPRRDSIIVTNTGPVLLHLYSITSSSKDFIITPKSDSLNPNTSKKYYVVFSPADTGIKTGAIVFTHDAAGPPDTVSVNGRGIAPTFSASTSSLVFGNLLVHGSKTDSFSLSNRGNVVVHFSATLTPTVGPFQFSPVTDSISPSGSRTFRVTFSPSDTGMRAGNIVVTFDAAGSPDTIPVNGRGIAPGFSSADTVNLGWVLLGVPFIDSLTVTNTGSSVLNVDTVRSDDTRITVSPHSASLVPLASQKFYITYTPDSVGAHSGHIIFWHNAAGSPDSVVVSGLNVTTMGQGCAIMPASLSLGTVCIGSSRMDSLMATNTGATRLLLSAHLSTDPMGLSLTPSNRIISALTSRYFYVTWAPPLSGGIQRDRRIRFFRYRFANPGTGDRCRYQFCAVGVAGQYYIWGCPDDGSEERQRHRYEYRPGFTAFVQHNIEFKKFHHHTEER
jgi:subtilisin family serine protease